MQHGKNYRKVAELIDRSKLYSPLDAIKLVMPGQTFTVKDMWLMGGGELAAIFRSSTNGIDAAGRNYVVREKSPAVLGGSRVEGGRFRIELEYVRKHNG